MTLPASRIVSPRLAGINALAVDPCTLGPAVVSLVGVLLLLVVAGLQLPAALASLFLLGCGVYASRVLALAHARSKAMAQLDADRQIARLASVYSMTAPLWIRQIETARSEADMEIAELSRVFGDITRRLDNVIGPAGLAGSGARGTDGDILAALAGNGADLDRLVAALRTLQASKELIVGEIGSQAARLKENAAEIRQIALHTRMVALNATIEAARAGAAGKPFGVIVADMRALASRTAEASEQFSRHTDRLASKVSSALLEQTAADGTVSIPWAQALVHKVVERFEAAVAQLTRSIDAMAQERSEVRQDVSRVLVALQFQDRVSQILSHITSNLRDLQQQIETDRGQSMDSRQWMERMAGPYSTPEEFGNLATAPLPVRRPEPEITYF